MSFRKYVAVAFLLPMLATQASAATLSFAGTGYTSHVLASNYDLVNGTYNGLTSGEGQIGDTLRVLTGDVKSGSNGLNGSGVKKVTLTYLGSEAGFTNISMFDIFSVFANRTSLLGDVFNIETADGTFAGLIPFLFATTAGVDGPITSQIHNDGTATGGTVNDMAIAFSDVFNGGRSVLAFFDDNGAGPDRDFDDLAMRIDISGPAAVPLPAAGLLLAGALGGLAALRRRRAA